MNFTSSLPPLPVDEVLPDLAAALRNGNRALLTAPPGSGKTTRVPSFLADAGPAAWGAGAVLVLEPRRLAARSAARYVARLRGGEAGGEVGYRVRLESRVSARTVIEFVTEGVLTRRLLADPELKGVACVVFDEFHERSLQADLGLALCLEAQQLLRPDLRLLIMSATLDADPLRVLLGDCPVLRSEGRLWPVDLRYLPPSLSAGDRRGGRPDPVPAVERAVRLALAEEPGGILAFLPGTGEIRRAAEALTGLPPGVSVHPLYGDLPAADQDAAIAPAPPGRRKIVLATSIAETSLTIEGVRVVIDAGLTRTMRFDPATGLDRLITERVTCDRADQRAGRAGRAEPGVCLRLWDEGEILAARARPEILEADLAPLLLDALSWGTRPEELAWLTPPPAAALARARRTLELLGAIRFAGPGTDRPTLTPHGEALARLPLHPRLGHMLLKAGEHAALAAAVAAVASERDPLRGHAATADLRPRLDCLRSGAHARLRRSAEQIYAAAGCRAPFRPPERADEEQTGRLIGLAWPERLAQRRARGSFRLASGRGAEIPADDPLADAPWLAVAALDAATGRVFLAAPLQREDIERDHGERLTREDTVVWDEREQAVLARRRTRLGALILDDAPLPPSADLAEAVRAAVLEGVRGLGLQCLPWTGELRQWQARVLLLRGLEPEQGWPDVSDAALLDTLTDWLAPWLDGVTRRAQFDGLDLGSALAALLPYPLQRRLTDQAPTRLPLPSGSSAAVDYRAEGGPVLAVKLQEMFGQTDTPCVAGGRTPLTLHLLSPAGRPLQITRDLAGFWRAGYPAVRAEMRGRYPRHPWPDDPLNATPTGKTKKRM